ncbi:hypothetical protein F53441_3348 [Fusarium austroafricanum]|uniref:PNPLA domain-containing protein n=1 Tax=Fusarium austroafricanum TaxID=2364996 RepID=A0A8H4KRR5_9HYPO|nr:hypothetical protein F53441_3348 [Fusarium austroafricanum]
MALPREKSLRILSLDGGGMKGYTSLLILQRIFRQLQAEAGLAAPPKPCEVFDLIVGTSTGGLIAIMLGRLQMTIDEAIEQYEIVGRKVFGRKPAFGKLGRLVKGLRGTAFYDIEGLQECVKDVLKSKGIAPDEAFITSTKATSCKVNFPSDLTRVLKRAIKMATDSQEIADRFSRSPTGLELANLDRYFRFNVPQGMEDLKLDEFEEADRMKALALYYLSNEDIGRAVTKCARALLIPQTQINSQADDQLVYSQSIPMNRPSATNSLLSSGLSEMAYKCLKSLYFQGMDQRRYSIKPASANTCGWLFKHKTFDDWIKRRNIETHQGLICIRGRPGSGKSTLMREAYERTREQRQGNAHTAAFFFAPKEDGVPGGPEALYRSLLCQLLPHRKGDFPKFVERYKEKQLGQQTDPVIWQEDELQTHLIYAAIFLSDGTALDVCISSRHFNAVALGSSPIIVVELNNKSDIWHYLNENLVLTEDEKENFQAFEKLKIKIADKASGIFLWAKLVTQTILKDRDEGKPMSDWEHRLSNGPEEIQGIFRGLLRETKEDKRDMTLRVFQWVILGGELRLHDWRSIFLFLEHGLPLRPSMRKYVLTDLEVERRIRPFTMGLVEVTIPEDSSPWEEISVDTNSVNGGAGSLDQNVGDTRPVTAIHRSVREFFLQQGGFLILDPELGHGAIGKGYIAIMHTCLDYISLPEFDGLVRAREDIQSDVSDSSSESRWGTGSRASSFGSARSLRYSQSLQGSASPTDFQSLKDFQFQSRDCTSNHSIEIETRGDEQEVDKNAAQQTTPGEMQDNRISRLDWSPRWASDYSPSRISKTDFSTKGMKSRCLPIDPSLLQYMLATFSIHARSAEKYNADAASIIFRLHNLGLWKRWISLNEDISKDTKLIHWAESERLTSWVTTVEPSIAAAVETRKGRPTIRPTILVSPRFLQRHDSDELYRTSSEPVLHQPVSSWSDVLRRQICSLHQSTWDAMIFRRPESDILHFNVTQSSEDPPVIESERISSAISKVRLHLLSYNSNDFPLHHPDGWFAQKKKETWKSFLREVYAWKRLENQCRGQDQPKLIPLLFTIEFKDEASLIFPWPSGDLNHFWMSNPGGGNIHTYGWGWVLSQCQRMSSCLAMIHQNEKKTQRPFLRYGDVTPQNIFWYNNSRGEGESDGLFLSNFAIVQRPSNEPSCFTAPEILAKPKPFSPKRMSREIGKAAHTWGLAWVWIQLTTWFLGGVRELNLYWNNTDHSNWIRQLQQHNSCTSHIYRFLCFIEERMLVENPTKRATAFEVSEIIRVLSTLTIGDGPS